MRRLSCFLVLAVMLAAAAAWAAGEALTVQVREIRMRSSPSFTGRPGAALSYGQPVFILEEQGAWVRADANGTQGWLHKSALTDRPVGFSSGERNTAAKAGEREVAAAGKGFTAETERAYRRGHPGGYAQVEAMLRFNQPPAALQAFLAAGKLVPRGGAQ